MVENQNLFRLQKTILDTPLGEMVAVASKTELYLLQFINKQNLPNILLPLESRLGIKIETGINDPINLLSDELDSYFKGDLQQFKTPIKIFGTDFQQEVYKQLINIPYGHVISYQEQAIKLGKKKAYRAVGNANGQNQLTIIVPCHRVVNSNGKLGGYAGGIERKKWLLEHEKNNM